MKFTFNNNTYWMRPGDKVPPGFPPDSGKIVSDVLGMTQEEINYANKEYDLNLTREMRKNEYPSIGDQLDALFHAGVFPQEMADKILAIKQKYPKPE